MKTIQIFSITILLFLTAFTAPFSASIEILCEKEICGCDAQFGAISGNYQETGREENGYPVYLGPNKDKSYEIKLRAETPKGADFKVYRWEIRNADDELIYFDSNIKTEPFSFKETKGNWTADNSRFEPIPKSIELH